MEIRPLAATESTAVERFFKRNRVEGEDDLWVPDGRGDGYVSKLVAVDGQEMRIFIGARLIAEAVLIADHRLPPWDRWMAGARTWALVEKDLRQKGIETVIARVAPGASRAFRKRLEKALGFIKEPGEVYSRELE